jgi:hypothetical protein
VNSQIAFHVEKVDDESSSEEESSDDDDDEDDDDPSSGIQVSASLFMIATFTALVSLF